MPHIQQREIPANRFGRLAEFDGQADSPADVQQFLQEHGYIVFRQCLDRERVMSARKEVLSRLGEVGEIAEPVIEGRVTGKSERPDPTEDRGEFWKSVNYGRALRELTHGRPTYDIVATVLGEAARGHDLMYLRPMPPGGVTPLHYDYPFFAGDSLRIHTVWIPIGDVSLCDGPLVMVENSSQFDDLLDPIRAIDFSDNRSNDAVQAAAYDAQNALHPIDLAEQRSVRLLSTDFEAGDVVVFSGFTLHGSLDNNSTDDCVRLSCDVRYQPAADPHTDERYFGADPKGSKGGGYADMRGAKPLRRS
ncbi:MAG: hypothetical protein HON53_22935 [Planctomycetaceae bacterium]|jgi:ectoine hydroxylase-related dioxygenase (phytanoyl-CoA dioxygenase family)|nr:hypothetical protein [Planctomycetaceae bacterium]MBT6154856.1 hypothetical protein [Planctomycetaceae bacterium]MBT6486723.1 hypothetical protein [Planctomycetaceae bacterium]MBT6494046.1 hypothetical protein [Planctomycetaceae bacterium]